MGLLIPAALVAASQLLIVASIFFISGKIAPVALAGIYAQTSVLSRTVIASILTMPLANYIVSVAYHRYDPALVTPLNLTAIIIIQVIFTLIVLQVKPSPWLIPATLMIIAGALWVNRLLSN